MKYSYLFFVLCLLCAGQPLSAQCSFSYTVSGTDHVSVVIVRKYIENWYQPSYGSPDECEARRNQALSQNSGSSVRVTCTPCSCVGAGINDNTQQPFVTVDFDKIQQGKGIVTTNPFDELTDGKDEYLYRNEVLYGDLETQNSPVALTGDKDFDDAVALIGKSRARIYIHPDNLKVNMPESPSLPSLSTFSTMPKIENKNKEWNNENSSDKKGIYAKAQEDYKVGSSALNSLNEKIKPVFDLLGVDNPLQKIIDKNNEAQEIYDISANALEGDYSGFTEKIKGVLIEESKNVISDITSGFSSTFQTIKGCFQVGEVLKKRYTEITETILRGINELVKGGYDPNVFGKYNNEAEKTASRIPEEGAKAWFNK
jgi:hypothetical protein